MQTEHVFCLSAYDLRATTIVPHADVPHADREEENLPPRSRATNGTRDWKIMGFCALAVARRCNRNGKLLRATRACVRACGEMPTRAINRSIDENIGIDASVSHSEISR